MMARRLLSAALSAACIAPLAAAAPAAAQGTLSEGGWTSENVEWLGHYAETAGVAEGGRLVGTTFFLTVNNQGLFSFDVSDPEAPEQLGRLVLPHGAENEDIATNGRIALLSQFGDVYHLSDGATGAGSSVNVVDVRDPADMKILASVPGGGDHTWDCLFDCQWAYSASGLILDLRDPAKPVLAPKRWREAFGEAGVSPGFAHDVTEVAPGMVMVATTPMTLLDARDPLNPRIVAQADEENSPNSHHNIVWPRQMRDRFVVTASEGQHMGRCEPYGDSASLQVWDATPFERKKTWTPMGSYKPVNGGFSDGDPPASATWYGCSAHWAETHPYWFDGGLVAGAFYSHGVKILGVGAAGEFEPVGWFLSHGAGASAVYWITERVLYVADDTRGLDVIRFNGELPPPPPPATSPPPVRPPSSPSQPLVDRRAPKVRVTVKRARRGRMAVTVRCDEDCYGRVGDRSITVRAGASKRVLLRRARSVRVVVSDRAGNRTVVRRKVR